MCHSAFCVRLGKVGSLISVSVVLFGVAALYQTHTGGFSLIV